MDVSHGVWIGQVQSVNFLGDELGLQEFACIDLLQDEVDDLWAQLPDTAEDVPLLQCNIMGPPALLSALGQLCAPGRKT